MNETELKYSVCSVHSTILPKVPEGKTPTDVHFAKLAFLNIFKSQNVHVGCPLHQDTMPGNYSYIVLKLLYQVFHTRYSHSSDLV